MPAVKTNERPGTRAVLRYCRMSGYKAREVLDLVRGMEYTRAVEILDHTDRAAATVVAKLLRSAAANAEHNDGLDPEELYVATAYADEGATLKRWRPRARGRATRIRKRTCHITVVLARMPDDQLARRRARVVAVAAERRARRVAGTRRRGRSEEVAEEGTSSARRASGRGKSSEQAAETVWPVEEQSGSQVDEVTSLEEPEGAVAPGIDEAHDELEALRADEASGDEASGGEASGDEAEGEH